MRYTRLFCAIGVSLLSAVVTGSQAAPTGALSEALRAHVKNDRFAIVTSVRGLPLGVRDALQTLFGSPTLDIAEPGAEFQVTDAISNAKLPIRRMVAAGCSTDSLPRLLRARRHRPHVASGAVSLDAGGDSIRVGRHSPRRPQDNRRRSERRPVRSDPKPEQVLVALTAAQSMRTFTAASLACSQFSQPQVRSPSKPLTRSSRRGQDPHGRRRLPYRRGAGDQQRPHRRHRHERGDRALRGKEHADHRRRRRHRHPRAHRQPLPFHARR